MNTSEDLQQTIKKIKEKVTASAETISDMPETKKDEDAKCKNPCSGKCKCMHTKSDKLSINHQ